MNYHCLIFKDIILKTSGQRDLYLSVLACDPITLTRHTHLPQDVCVRGSRWYSWIHQNKKVLIKKNITFVLKTVKFYFWTHRKNTGNEKEDRFLNGSKNRWLKNVVTLRCSLWSLRELKLLLSHLVFQSLCHLLPTPRNCAQVRKGISSFVFISHF